MARDVVAYLALAIAVVALVLTLVFHATKSSSPSASATHTVAVPNVVGMKRKDALTTLQQDGLQAKTKKAKSTSSPKGVVTAQSPAAGSRDASGTTVALTISSGP